MSRQRYSAVIIILYASWFRTAIFKAKQRYSDYYDVHSKHEQLRGICLQRPENILYIRMCMHDKHAMYIFTSVERIAAGESDKVERNREMYLPKEHAPRGTYTQQLRQL